MRRLTFAVMLTFALFGEAASAGAVVIDPAVKSVTPVEYKTAEQGNYFGVALVPGTRSQLEAAEIPAVKSKGPCEDPALAPDLKRPEVLKEGLCSHGGPVMHANETFVLVWDPERRYFSGTKEYVEQFLRDVADGSGTLTSPYAVATQYTDSTGRAGNASLYGGACEDFGVSGGSACEFLHGTGTGHNYPERKEPPNGCKPSGTTNTIYVKGSNDYCLTDAQIKVELTSVIEQTGIIGHTQPGYTPMLVLLTPPGVETCLDATGKLCSATTESAAPAQFCSYHSRVSVGGTEVDYVVQPWTALAEAEKVRECDEPDVPTPPETPNEATLGAELGAMLVSPLSRSQIAAIVNPEFNGWFALDGSEIDDNTCKPLAGGLDSATVGKNAYLLQREFNNGGLLVTDPYAQRCEPHVVLEPKFVVPSPINHGNAVEFDGSVSPSTLIVPAAGYDWEFGDGTKATGPSVEHTYAEGGTYSVKLTLTDRGGNEASVTQTIDVIGPPTSTAPPAISDATSLGANVAAGDDLEASTGSFAGYPTPFTDIYKWLSCNATGTGCAAIAGANGTAYTPVSADIGHTIRVEVTATNSVGSGTATSAPTSVVGVHPVLLQTSNGIAAVSGPGAASAVPQAFTLTALLIPESHRQLLRDGVTLHASATQAADGVASVFISPTEARHAHIYFRRGQSLVLVGRGTIKGLGGGAGTFHLKLSKKVMARLKRLRRVVLTVQLLAVDKAGDRRLVTLSGRY